MRWLPWMQPGLATPGECLGRVIMRAAQLKTVLPRELLASVVVFLVALPLCMGIAIASGMPPAKGLLTGIIGGLVVGWLAGSRNWLSGEQLTFADLAAAAELSVVDYVGDVPWDEDLNAKYWYARIKSRPTFRTLLADRLAGLLQGMVQKSGKSVGEVRAAQAAPIPAKRFGTPAEFGAVCAFLCSQQAAYLTGQNILLDGGAYPGTF